MNGARLDKTCFEFSGGSADSSRPVRCRSYSHAIGDAKGVTEPVFVVYI